MPSASRQHWRPSRFVLSFFLVGAIVPLALMTFGWIAGTRTEHTYGGHTTMALWTLLWVIWPTWIFMLDAEHPGTIAFMLVLAGIFNGVWYVAAATFFRYIGASLKRLASRMARRRGKTAISFALLGLAMAALSYANAAFHNYGRPINGLDFITFAISVIVCPPQLLFAFCIDCEVIGRTGLIMYSVIGVLNVALYAAIGAGVAGLQNPSSSN